jgi:hypothetical protein
MFMDWIPIRLGPDFWDVPLLFTTKYKGGTYLFHRPFREEIDDYGPYNVYLLPELPAHDLSEDWSVLHTKAVRSLGEVSLSEVRFDWSEGHKLDAAVLDRLIARERAG